MVFLLVIIIQFLILSCGNPSNTEVVNSNNITRSPDKKCISFIGNSFHDEGIDFERLRSSTGFDIEHHWEGGISSAWWYAMLFRRILLDSINGYVFMTIYHDILTAPSDRTSGIYRDKIRKVAEEFPQILDTVDNVLNNATKINDSWDFWSSVNYSFLPRIIKLCRNNNIQLIFARMRTARDVKNPKYETEKEIKYKKDLLNYLSENNVVLLDYSKDPEIELLDFSDGWHLNPLGKSKWTSMILADFNDIFRNIRPFHKSETIASSVPFTIQSPKNRAMVRAAQKSFFKISHDKKVKWSYILDGTQEYEKYLGPGSLMNTKIPPFDYKKRKITVYAFDGYSKESIQCSLTVDSGTNLPPKIDAGPDMISYVGQETQLKVNVSDDHVPSQELSYKWRVIRGSADLKNSNKSEASIIPVDDGLIIASVTVSDGEYSCLDNISVNVNKKKKFIILSPEEEDCFSHGETVHIKWEVVNVDDCVISISYNNGRSYELISEKAITMADSTWGNYPWIIPDDAPETDAGRIKLSDYKGTVSTISLPFVIKKSLR